MADHEAIKRRKERWISVLQTMRGGLPNATFANLAQTKTKQLEAASNYFDIDLKDSTDCLVLLRVLADIAFSRKAPGRKRGSNVWTAAKLILLGAAYETAKTKNPGMSDLKIAGVIYETNRKQFGSRETVRQRLPAARRQYAKTLGLGTPKKILGL
jgi:hypothetical protein